MVYRAGGNSEDFRGGKCPSLPSWSHRPWFILNIFRHTPCTFDKYVLSNLNSILKCMKLLWILVKDYLGVNYVTETEFQVLLGLVPNYNEIKEMKKKQRYILKRVNFRKKKYLGINKIEKLLNKRFRKKTDMCSAFHLKSRFFCKTTFKLCSKSVHKSN